MIVANYGGDNNSGDLPELIYSGSKVGDTDNDVITFDPGCEYIMYAAGWTTDTGEVIGHMVRHITTPDGDSFGTAAVTHTAAGTDSGSSYIVGTWATDSTFAYKCASTDVTVKVSIYKIGG